MRRLALLGTIFGGLAIAAAACRESPVQPLPNGAIVPGGAAFATTSTATTCENLIYPYTLCAYSYRPQLCAALNNTNGPSGYTITGIPYGSRKVDATFVRTAYPDPVGARETAKVYLPGSSYPPSVMTFPIVTQAQIDSNALCPPPSA